MFGHVGTGKSAAWQAFVRAWARIFGLLEVVVVDPGTESQGALADDIQNNGARLFPTDARAPRQNGRAELAGEGWKRQFRLAMRKLAPNNLEEWCAVGELCFPVRNRYQNRGGFSQMQRVFGFAQRLPATLLSGDPIDPEHPVNGPSAGLPSSLGPLTRSHEGVGCHGRPHSLTTRSAGTPPHPA